MAGLSPVTITVLHTTNGWQSSGHAGASFVTTSYRFGEGKDSWSCMFQHVHQHSLVWMGGQGHAEWHMMWRRVAATHISGPKYQSTVKSTVCGSRVPCGNEHVSAQQMSPPMLISPIRAGLSFCKQSLGHAADNPFTLSTRLRAFDTPENTPVLFCVNKGL